MHMHQMHKEKLSDESVFVKFWAKEKILAQSFQNNFTIL